MATSSAQDTIVVEVVFENGSLRSPQRPGLGVELDRGALEFFVDAARAIA